MKSTVDQLTRQQATGFPIQRMRRLRRTQALREMVKETTLSPKDFIYPMFVTHDYGQKRDIPSMPGIFQLSIDLAAKEAEEVAGLGIPAVLLFGLPIDKDPVGSEACDPQGVIQKAIGHIKEAVPEIIVITDVCLCEYTDHGHCGIIEDGYVDNDQTLELLARSALSHAEAGADIVNDISSLDDPDMGRGVAD